VRRRSGGKEMRDEKVRFIKKWEDHETRRVTKSMLWKAYMQLNEVKVEMNNVRLSISHTKWEREYAEFLRETWGSESDDADPGAAEVIYRMTTTFCRDEYIGETTITKLLRMKTHIMKAVKKGKQMVSKFLRKVGVHRGIWTTVKAWRTKSTKVQRLKNEGRMMWMRGASLNNVGMCQGGADFSDRRGTMLFGARRRFRYVTRFTTKSSRKRMSEKEKVERVERKVKEKAETAKKWKSDFHWTAKLARRPWTKMKESRLKNMRVVQEVRAMDAKRLKHLVGMVYKVLDMTGRSVATVNLKKILRWRKDFRWVNITVRSASMEARSARRVIQQDLKEWANRIQEEYGVILAIRLRIVACATESIMTAMNNTGTEAKKKKEELRCHCNSVEAEGLRKVSGHVLAPLLTTMSEEVSFPKGWSAKSRCRPTWEKQQQGLEEQLEKAREKVLEALEIKPKGAKLRIRWGKIEECFEAGGGSEEKQVKEEDLDEWKWRLRNFIRSPIDKYPGEMVII